MSFQKRQWYNSEERKVCYMVYKEKYENIDKKNLTLTVDKLVDNIMKMYKTHNFSEFCDLYTESKDKLDELWLMRKEKLIKENYGEQ